MRLGHSSTGYSSTFDLARLTAVAYGATAVNDILGGAIRYALMRAGLTWLSYLPSLFTGCVVISYIAYAVATSRASVGLLAITGLFVVQAVYSVFVGMAVRRSDIATELARTAFALYTWIQFMLGVIIVCQRQDRLISRAAPLLWVAAVAGVIVSRFAKLPWTGMAYEILGQESKIARDWTTNGMERLAGLSRASYTAANQIAFLSMLLIASATVSKVAKYVIWPVSILAVAMTTSKTPLALTIVGPLVVTIYRHLTATSRQRSLGQLYGGSVIGCLSLAMVLLPITSKTSDILLSNLPTDVGFLTLTTMVQRSAGMWPGAFDLLSADHNRLEWIFGRGLGGIGSAQNIFEPLIANSADNMFVFLFVTFGVSSLLFVACLCKGAIWGSPEAAEQSTVFAMATSVLMLGIATNVVESAFPAIALGSVVAHSFAIQRHARVSQQQINGRFDGRSSANPHGDNNHEGIRL